jgi:hypothetical protein
MSKTHFMEAAEACIANGERLLNDVDWMIWEERPSATCFVLATIAQGEFAKAFFLFLVDKGIIPWNSFVARATRDHSCKQLLGLVLNHLDDWNEAETERRHRQFMADIEEHKCLIAAYDNSSIATDRTQIWARIEELGKKLDLHFELPASVADAIFILRHEKIGRWVSKTWSWSEKPTHDPFAKRIARGKLDQEKQDALYVRLACDGRVAKTPTTVKYEEAKAAMELAKKMRWFVKHSIEKGTGTGRDYDKIELAFKSAFESLTEDVESLAS